ncbi:MAG: heparinase II/III family protein [Armatimonadota bacterium]
MQTIARDLCEKIDWQRPELAQTAFADAYRAGDTATAAMGFVRYLRERERPVMGYSAAYITQLREHATPEFRAEAEATIQRLLYVKFQGGDWPDGRGTLLSARPEVLQVAGRREDFLRFARVAAEARDTWHTYAIHTTINIARYLQSVWPLEECPDEAVLPLLGFLTVTFDKEWAWTRTWSEPMLGTTGHNWWIAQLGGTYKIGLLFPEFKGFAQFQALHPTYIEREMRILTFPDGFTHEASVAYHIGTTDLFLDAARIAEANGLTLSSEFYQRLRAMAEVEWKLLQPDGNYPAFGDCFNWGPHLFERMRSLAALLQIPEAKYLAETMDPERKSSFGSMQIETLNYPAIGEDLQPMYDALVARPPATIDTALPDADYYAMRQDWTTGADYLAIEASDRGNLVTSHGHSAIFDIKLCSRGRAIMVGNGKGPDGSEEPERTWRVGNFSHSAASVDGQDHAPLRSVYRFARVVVPTVDDWISEPDYAYFSGAHEAYEMLEKKVTGSRRKIFYLRGGYWILLDRFTANSPEDAHTYQQHFQVLPTMRDLGNGKIITEGEGGNLLFHPVDDARGEASTGPCPYPLEEYFNPNQLCYTQQATGNGLFVTLMVPFLNAEVPQVQARLVPVTADKPLSPFEATGVEIIINGQRDLYVDLHMQWNLPWTCAEYQGQDRLFHSRCMC